MQRLQRVPTQLLRVAQGGMVLTLLVASPACKEGHGVEAEAFRVKHLVWRYSKVFAAPWEKKWALCAAQDREKGWRGVILSWR